MKKLFIPYELALLAKEKGFDEPCFAAYVEKEFRLSLAIPIINHNDAFYLTCSAPLYQQIIDWFRETHRINILIHPHEKFYLEWMIEHQYLDGNKFHSILANKFFTSIRIKTYYEALNKAIEEAFKLI